MAVTRSLDGDGWVDRIHGSLLGGAIGDALGAGIEFDSIGDIRAVHGAAGVTDFVPAYGRPAPITDDTQMTLFTLEGILRASVRSRSRGIASVPAMCHRAYLRWLTTQGSPWPHDVPRGPDGWLVGVGGLHHRRAPGTTCLASLTTGQMGTVDRPLNTSKGCGALMRVAPAGFVWRAEDAFDRAVEIAALTHGHPTGYLTAGVLAVVISGTLDGESLDASLATAEASLRGRADAGETADAIAWGRARRRQGLPTPEELDGLNARASAGWVAEEALAIGLRVALAVEHEAGTLDRADSDLVRAGLLAAVNHSGDSDSTGSIAGNILGAAVGAGGLPADWAPRVELADVIATLAADAVCELSAARPRIEPPDGEAAMDEEVPDAWRARYPGA